MKCKAAMRFANIGTRLSPLFVGRQGLYGALNGKLAMVHVMLIGRSAKERYVMNISKYLIATAIVGSLSVVYCARADDDSAAKSMDDDNVSYPLYRPQEINVDLFGSGALGEETVENLSGSRFRHHVLYGGGGGLTLFFLRYVGVGGEYDADARAHRFVDSASGNVYLRYPIKNTGLSPYIFGGGGYQFEEIRQSFGQGGAGLEYRFCRHLGIFADGRWVFARQTEDYALVRAGLRISF